MAMRAVLALAMLMLALVIGVWDVTVMHMQRPDDTVSRFLWDLSRGWPIVPFLLGILFGHILWPQRLVPLQ